MDQNRTSFHVIGNKPIRRRRLLDMQEYDLNRQTKNVIANVSRFIKKLNDPKVLETVDFKKSQETTSKLCGVSLRSVQRSVEQKNNLDLQFSSPRRLYSRAKPQTDLSDSECDLVRKTILEFQDKGEIPTAEKVRAVLHEKIGYSGSVWSVRRLLRTLDLKPKKPDFNLVYNYSQPSSSFSPISSTPASEEPFKMETVNQIMKECYDYFQQTKEWDEHSVYGENVANRLRKIRNSKRLCTLRNKIDNMIYEAELEEYDELVFEPTTHFLHGSKKTH